MPPIRFGGLASGLPPNLVETIMAQERMPIQSMEQKKVGINAKLELIGDLETRLRSIDDNLKEIVGVGGFKDYSLDVSREGIVSGSIDPEQAATGAWSLEVFKNATECG